MSNKQKHTCYGCVFEDMLFFVLFRSITFLMNVFPFLSESFGFLQTIVSSIERHNTDSMS